MKSDTLISLARVPRAELALAAGAAPQQISAPGALGTRPAAQRCAWEGLDAGQAALPRGCEAAGAEAKSAIGLKPTIRGVSTPAASAAPRGVVPFLGPFCLLVGDCAEPVGMEKKEGPNVGTERFPRCPQRRAVLGWFCCVLSEPKEMLSAPSSFSPVMLIIIQSLHSRLYVRTKVITGKNSA